MIIVFDGTWLICMGFDGIGRSPSESGVNRSLAHIQKIVQPARCFATSELFFESLVAQATHFLTGPTFPNAVLEFLWTRRERFGSVQIPQRVHLHQIRRLHWPGLVESSGRHKCFFW